MRLARLTSFAVIMVLQLSAASGQATWFVDAAATGPATGSAGSPFPSIQAGINAAANGDTFNALSPVASATISP